MKPLLILFGAFIIVMTMWLTFMPDLRSDEPVRKLKTRDYHPYLLHSGLNCFFQKDCYK